MWFTDTVWEYSFLVLAMLVSQYGPDIFQVVRQVLALFQGILVPVLVLRYVLTRKM